MPISDAAAMMGLSDKMYRTELLRLKATGGEKEYSDFMLKLLEIMELVFHFYLF